MVFFSYRTKRESPAGDQFWKLSRQCSIFGHIGDQWVAILSPVLTQSSSVKYFHWTSWQFHAWNYKQLFLQVSEPNPFRRNPGYSLKM